MTCPGRPRPSGPPGIARRERLGWGPVLATAPAAARTPAPVVRKIVHLRWKQRLGPVQIGDRLGMPASTVHAVLVRCRLNRLTHIDRATGEPIRRYEHANPATCSTWTSRSSATSPTAGLALRRAAARRAEQRGHRGPHRLHPQQVASPLIGTAYVHTVIDDHSRVAYAEIHDDETAATATEVLRNAVAWYTDRGVTVQRVLSDNGSCYRSFLWRDTCPELGITPKRTRPTDPRPTARSNASTAPWPRAGPSRSSTAPNPPAAQPCQHGSTSTTTTGPTPPSAKQHPSPGWTTWLGITASRERASLLQLGGGEAEQAPRDHEQLDLLGALEDVEDLGVPGPLLEELALGSSRSAGQLDAGAATR